MHASNNGHAFTKTDWERVAAIANGNVDVNSVGQFGVGFFSVFAYSDQPIITSGKEYMTFVWRDDHTLMTYRRALPVEERSHLTSIILQMRSPLIVQMSSNLDGKHKTELSKTKKTNLQKKTVSIHKIIPKLDLE
ncbi:unnamed protein product [Rotaria sp. Silwood1]|nr:unnamed protein product [Rotaria sp. Silwood1]CAF1610075.1 unnamed protein product [Rotaria sp. Silwood1]CAF3708953.1 unnamed protein product [Rotaria sp. Silwood1]CAF3716140.1 unnamed protein product [Rotaria sp. Silwood1]CAF3740260.1 unnamed protein product [Rotaria sp. Silwood1]